jgi:hypothetical protein
VELTAQIERRRVAAGLPAPLGACPSRR